MYTYSICYKEVGSDTIRTTRHTGRKMTVTELVKFFGLDQKDITWFGIAEDKEQLTPVSLKRSENEL